MFTEGRFVNGPCLAPEIYGGARVLNSREWSTLVRVSAKLTNERRCKEWRRVAATFNVKETSGLSIFDERCRSLARSSGSQPRLAQEF